MALELIPTETKVKWSQRPAGSKRPLLPPADLSPSSGGPGPAHCAAGEGPVVWNPPSVLTAASVRFNLWRKSPFFWHLWTTWVRLRGVGLEDALHSTADSGPSTLVQQTQCMLIFLGQFWKERVSRSLVRLFMTPWTAAHQAPLSIEFSRPAYWSGPPFPSPGDLPHPGTEPRSPTLQADSSPSGPPGNSSILKANMENLVQKPEARSSSPFSLSKCDNFDKILENQHWRETGPHWALLSYFPDRKAETQESKTTFKSREQNGPRSSRQPAGTLGSGKYLPSWRGINDDTKKDRNKHHKSQNFYKIIK